MKGYVKPVLSACALSSTERIAVSCEDTTDRNDWIYQWESRNADGEAGKINSCADGFYRYSHGS